MKPSITSLTKETLEAKIRRAWESWEKRMEDDPNCENRGLPSLVAGDTLSRKAEGTEDPRVSQVV